MKTIVRLTALVLCVCTLCAVLTACKDEKYEAYDRTGEPYDYYLPDYVKVCDYKGIEIPNIVYVPSEEDVQNRLKQLAGYYSERTEDPDRPCRKYDYVDIITTCKFTDTGETYHLFNFEKNDNGIGQTFLLGTNHFRFPALEDAIVGMSQGETKKVTLKVPDPFYKDYMNSGREVEFEIYLNYIDEVDFSGIDDQFYHDHYGYAGESMNNYIVEELRKEFNGYIEGYEIALTWNYICENSSLKKRPEKEYKATYDSYLNSDRAAAESKELTLAEYVKDAYGYEKLDDYYAFLEKKAENKCFEDMLLYYIIRYENLDYDEEFYNMSVLSMTEAFDISDVASAEDFLRYYMGDEALHESVLMQYTQDWIAKQAVVRDDVDQFFSDKLN